ncbi:MAG: hypothetical protein JJU29_04405 [Verrucomicrobia bacterium]|nr:hypothetical protein [Verrucomicrobiota bacterium]MCH8512077.1 hypothetical protein [Kiritimatiellia bacterium]
MKFQISVRSLLNYTQIGLDLISCGYRLGFRAFPVPKGLCMAATPLKFFAFFATFCSKTKRIGTKASKGSKGKPQTSISEVKFKKRIADSNE